MCQLVDAITCEIIDPASQNSVCGFFTGRSLMISNLGHLDICSRSQYTVSACEIIDQASPNLVFRFFIGRSQISSYLVTLTGRSACERSNL